MNSLNLIGILKEKIDEYHRYLEYERPFEQEKITKPGVIPVKFWTNQPDSRLMCLEVNTRVAINGHLDAGENFETVVIVEELQVLK